ncbi:MAG: cytochrome C oxidase subunit II [Planctomycetes bacterium]|nr:cytochrome C oxidase subunit II [Planctomycetota bacterium]MBI3843577.1 cytochrome C oxidase subunit II [Planctomycetota bacterium]
MPSRSSIGARITLAVAASLGPCAGLALAGEPENPGWRMPHDVSTAGWRTDWLINITFLFITILFAIMVGWMLLACVRFGAKREAAHDYGDSRRAIFLTIATAMAIFVTVDGNLFVNSTRDLEEVVWNFKIPQSDPNAVRIEINAHQWAWDARYAGPDGKFNTADDVVTLDDVRIPIDTPVIVQMGAVDVIHCLYLPNFRIKQDVVPGMITRTWFQAKETGEFEIACAQHCGANHYKMRGLLRVLSRAEYDAWLAAASNNSERAYDSADEDAHWGWEWREI